MGLLKKAIHQKKINIEKIKRPFAHLTARDIEIYLGSPEELGSWRMFIDNFARLSDFFSFGKALFLTLSDDSSQLDLIAWSLADPVPSFSIPLEPALKFRLSVPFPQILLGAENLILRNLSVRWLTKSSVPIAFPFTTPQRTLYAVIILLDIPAFDLEDDLFLASWNALRDYVLQLFIPEESPSTPNFSQVLQKILESGRQILSLELPLMPFIQYWLRNEEAPGPRIKEVYHTLKKLVGSYSAILSFPQAFYSFHALSPPVTAEVFLHQINTILNLPSSLKSIWKQHLFRNMKEIDEYLIKNDLFLPS